MNSTFITSYERDNETELDFAQARMHDYGHGRFTSPDPLQSSASPNNPQTWNRYVYVLNNPVRLTDSTGLAPDILVQGNEQEAYLERLQKETPSLVLAIDPNTNKVVVTGFRANQKDGDNWVGHEEEIVSQMSDSERALYTAITDTQNTATIDTTRGDGNIDFGRYDGPGHNTVDMQDLDVLDNSGDVGFTSSQVVGHETLESYASSQGNASDPNLQSSSHNSANQHFPGLGRIVGGATPFVNQQTNFIEEYEQTQPIHNSNINVTIRYRLVNSVLYSPTPKLSPSHIIRITN